MGDEYRLTEYPKQKDFIEELIKEITGETKIRLIGNELGDFKTYYDQYQQIRKMEGVQARLPYTFIIE